MLDSGDPVDERDKVFPTLSLRVQRLSPSWCQAVVSAPALLCLLDPTPDDPLVLLEPVEQRI
jgi:hypothetical protein